ncbi:MAG: DNA-3-methyladenine glycosylase family protein [Rickettsiales bacterium]
MTPDFWHDAKTHLSKKDKTLKKIIAGYDGEMMVTRGDAFYTLARSIAGQQISVKAADSIWKRIESATNITPKAVLSLSHEELRSCGLSNSKVTYMQALAEHFRDNAKQIKHWPEMDDEEIIKELTTVKGIGRWSAEMFLLFHLARPDVFPVGDLGLLKAIYRHYNASQKMPLPEVRKLAEPWKPYRSVATWYLWRSLDPLPVAY